jgi:hypothetical protein
MGCTPGPGRYIGRIGGVGLGPGIDGGAGRIGGVGIGGGAALATFASLSV